MRQTVNINGYETVIEIPEGEILSPIRYTGDEHSYTIEYGNGLVETGGVIDVPASAVVEGVVEGVVEVPLNFVRVLDYQATALNVVSSPSALTGESCFLTRTERGIKVYATARSNSSTSIPVKWNAKGLK